MLPPDALDHLPDRLVQSLESLCEEIAADMARRISKTGFLTETAVHQYTRLRELYGREVYDYVLERLQAWTQYTKPELHELFEEAGEAALEYDNGVYRAAGFSPAALSDSPALLALVQAGWEKTGGLFENLVRTTAEGTQIAFIEASDRAHWQVLSGAFDYQTAIKNAVMEIADAGPIVRYPSGARAAVDVAVRRCVLTGVNQTCCKVQEARMDELGCTLVETTAHAGARPSHMVWQGRVFSRFGQTDQYEDFVTATGYGTGNGLGGWNCRHSFFPYFEGLSENAYPKEELREMESKTVFYNGEEIPLYDATQMQRKNERDIRRHKRRISGLEAASVEKKDVQAAKAALRQAQAKQRDFCSQTGLQRDYFRERGDKQNRISPKTSLKLMQNGNIGDILTNTSESVIMKSSITEDEETGVRFVGKLDREIYKVVTSDIQTDTVIITDRQIAHVQERHPTDYERFSNYLPEIIAAPDYILEANKPNTAFVLKYIEDGGENFEVIVRLKTSEDPKEYQNSIITFLKMRDKEWRRLLNNKKILYKRE